MLQIFKKNPPLFLNVRIFLKVKSRVKNKRKMCYFNLKVDNHDIVTLNCEVNTEMCLKIHRMFIEIEQEDKEPWNIKSETEIC